MAITIKAVRVNKFDVKRENDGGLKLEGDYSLISSTETVIAKQSFNGYSDIKLQASPETLKAQAQLLSCIQKDLSNLLGLEA